MSDWGLVSFRYDCEQIIKHVGKKRRVKGLISKAYDYPGMEGILLHAYNGVKYFLEAKNYKTLFFGLSKRDLEGSNWAEFDTAFDVFWDSGVIKPGYDNVKHVMNRWDQLGGYDSDEKLQYDLFSCEGMYGFLHISYTSNLDGEEELKYGYLYEDKVLDIKGALDEYARIRDISEDLPDYLKEIITFFDDNAKFIGSEDAYWEMEKQGVALIHDVMEGNIDPYG
ncbi:hypothetical protein SAMN02910292_01232 [Lachnospiraceae bacterium XBB2008]|nr:hypothetical protein SAMN02910292_01232 [Lachnospiraceae bacterium XBB2008]